MNPLLTRELPIPFARIRAEHVVPAVREALAEAERDLAALVERSGPRTYADTLQALEDIGERLGRVVRPVSHLVAVMDTPELRAHYETVVPEFTAFYARIPLNEGLWRALKELAATDEARALDPVRARHLEKTLRSFRRMGADLPPEAKARVEALRVEMSRLQTDFANRVLDATNAFELVITDPEELAGLPESAVAQARADAAAKGLEGWRFTLHQPSLLPVLQYAERREHRQAMYRAYFDRGAAPPSDTRPLVRRILELRRELARLLGYGDYADYALEESMAGTGAAAIAFEEDLTARTRPYWRRDLDEVEAFARTELGIDPLEPWDVSFAAERLRRARYDFDAEELRPYFPLDRVLEGLFEISRRLFGVVVTSGPAPEPWHPQVGWYDVHDEESGALLGGFYTDWFPRESKRGGAWMNGLVVGGPRGEGEWEPHLAVIAGNVSPPEGHRPALLTHREVETVFHEFGHLLHHTLSRVEVAALGSTRVPADWVELPSQIMENWVWERPALDLFARHHRTGEPIPEALYRKMLAARRFMGGHVQMRQLSYGTVDLDLHVRWDPASGEDPVRRAQEVMARFAPRPEFARDHFVTSFTHIFSGGYAAGYYSYLWSEVLDADAFTRFEREGLFNREAGRAFVRAVLSRGDSADPAELFREFMGRDPDPTALLRRNLGADDARAPSEEGAEVGSAAE